jgi:hypothetical protein
LGWNKRRFWVKQDRRLWMEQGSGLLEHSLFD